MPIDSYERIIEADKSPFHIDVKSILHYRDLLFILVRRDFITRYKQTVLGYFWHILQPLLTTVIFVVVFSLAVKISTGRIPPVLFYLCGLSIWNFFSKCLSSSSQVLLQNAGLFNKVYFPRLIIPLSVVLSNFMTFFIQWLTFLAFYFGFMFFSEAEYGMQTRLLLLLVPVLVVQTAMLGLGFGMLISALSVKYRDLIFLVEFVMQLWMYVTPIIYPLSVISENWRIFFMLNPMAFVVEAFKYVFFGTGILNYGALALSLGITCVVFLIGFFAFQKVERTFVDFI